jgi:hypothetical protein
LKCRGKSWEETGMFIVQIHANTTLSDNVYILLRFMYHSHVAIPKKKTRTLPSLKPKKYQSQR